MAAADFLRALYHDDALILVIIDLLDNTAIMHEHLIAVQCNVELRRIRAKLYELERAKWITAVCDDTWSLSCDNDHILHKLVCLQDLLKPVQEEDVYLCKSCNIKVSMVELMDQFALNPETLFCLTCNGALVDDDCSSHIENEIQEVKRRLIG